jgi:hypothetical protein
VSPSLGLSYPVETYRHVAVVFDRGQVRWYLDGELIETERVTVERVDNPDRPTYIGREFSENGGVQRFEGGIDELRYYERALDGAAIRGLMGRSDAD